MAWLSLGRYAVFGLVVFSTAVAVGHWALRTGRVSPFSFLGRRFRRTSDFWIAPMERRLARFGRNPHQAGWWFAGAALLGGVLTLSLVEWIAVTGGQMVELVTRGGAQGVYVLVVMLAYRVLILTLIVRILASWFHVEPYARWFRPVYFLTEWYLRPLRSWIPPIGMVDISPFVAWFGLAIAQRILLSFV